MTLFITNQLQILNSFLAAGIAITAFSLLLYTLTFNLRDNVARSVALILVSVDIVFVSEALGSVASNLERLDFWLRIQWLGIVFLPISYLHFSDALLATTGKPSRGRRRWLNISFFIVTIGFLAALQMGYLVGPLVPNAEPAPHLQRTILTWIFSLFYLLAMLISGFNFYRAFKRTTTSTSRRRMSYLVVGALAPALGSYPYLLFGSGVASKFPLFFWLLVTVGNLLVTLLLVLMAYATAFFGVTWPDRVVKRRLFKWLLRGPVTASTVLILTTILRRIGTHTGIDLTRVVPAAMAASILIIEHLITLTSPALERWLFAGKDRTDLERLQTLDERLLTSEDLQQFLESILAAVCDRMQVSKAFIASIGPQGVENLVLLGDKSALEEDDLPINWLKTVAEDGETSHLFEWGDHWLVPLFDPYISKQKTIIGLMGINRQKDQNFAGDQIEALELLAHRAALAIGDRFRQEQVFSSLDELSPQIETIQRLRAAARYAGTDVLTAPEIALEDFKLSPLVKDALTHYWGGPKLTMSPLLNLEVVKKTAEEQKESPINALREILRKAIENVRPEGERKFTGEWILYNILELKFLEGHRVREVAMRLAMSEADLYRKQRVAIETVSDAILQMEQDAIRQINLSGGSESSIESIE
jgi:hypothetical protein